MLLLSFLWLHHMWLFRLGVKRRRNRRPRRRYDGGSDNYGGFGGGFLLAAGLYLYLLRPFSLASASRVRYLLGCRCGGNKSPRQPSCRDLSTSTTPAQEAEYYYREHSRVCISKSTCPMATISSCRVRKIRYIFSTHLFPIACIDS